jgi:membrane protein involved in colicin uptake
MKKLKKDLEAILKALNGLAQKVEKLQEQIGEETKPKKKPKAKALKKKAARKAPKKRVVVKKTAPKKAAPVTAVDTVFGIIKNSKKGIGTTALMEKTGYNQKKIANLVFKLRKQGKIKSVDRGVYVKA